MKIASNWTFHMRKNQKLKKRLWKWRFQWEHRLIFDFLHLMVSKTGLKYKWTQSAIFTPSDNEKYHLQVFRQILWATLWAHNDIDQPMWNEINWLFKFKYYISSHGWLSDFNCWSFFCAFVCPNGQQKEIWQRHKKALITHYLVNFVRFLRWRRTTP